MDNINSNSPIDIKVQCELCAQPAYWQFQGRYSLCKVCAIKYHSDAEQGDLVRLSVRHIQELLRDFKFDTEPTNTDLKKHVITEDYPSKD